MLFLLWILAVIIFVYGVVRIVQGHSLIGVLLLIVACLVGPGGYSIFR